MKYTAAIAIIAASFALCNAAPLPASSGIGASNGQALGDPLLPREGAVALPKIDPDFDGDENEDEPDEDGINGRALGLPNVPKEIVPAPLPKIDPHFDGDENEDEPDENEDTSMDGEF